MQGKGLAFLLIFAFFVENHLLGNTKLSSLVYGLRVTSSQAKGLIFLIIFLFFVENHLLENTKLSYVRQSICPSHFYPEHISKSIEVNLMKLDTLIEGHEGNCRMQEP